MIAFPFAANPSEKLTSGITRERLDFSGLRPHHGHTAWIWQPAKLSGLHWPEPKINQIDRAALNQTDT